MRWFHISARLGASSQCRINNEMARRPWHWGAPLVCQIHQTSIQSRICGDWWKGECRRSYQAPKRNSKVPFWRAWNSVTPEDCYRTVSSMPQRIRAVIAQRVLLPSTNYSKLLWQLMFLLYCVEFESFFQYDIFFFISFLYTAFIPL